MPTNQGRRTLPHRHRVEPSAATRMPTPTPRNQVEQKPEPASMLLRKRSHHRDETVHGQTHSSWETKLPNSTVPVSNDRALTSPVSPASPAQTSTNRGVHAANAATTPNGTVSSALPVRPPAITSPSATSSSNPRHLSPNPPAINGATGSEAHNSTALRGTGMHHRR